MFPAKVPKEKINSANPVIDCSNNAGSGCHGTDYGAGYEFGEVH